MSTHPIAIIGDGRIVTRDGARPYPTLAILHCSQLATIALSEGAPLGALWLQPGTDVARAARDAAFWAPQSGWRVFTTGMQGGAVGYATIRRDGADVHGAARREVPVFADLPGRWRLGADFSGEDGARRLLTTVRTAQGALAQALDAVAGVPPVPFEYSPASSALAALRRLCDTPRRAGWLPSLSAETLADLPWPRPMTPSHVNRTPRDGQYVHVYDKNAAYLAACKHRFGYGEPKHVSFEDINDELMDHLASGKVYGMWRVSGHTHLASNDDATPLPGPFGRATDIDDLWCYTPHVELAIKLDWELAIHEGYYWPNTHSALSDWATVLWCARQNARREDRAAEQLLKHCFTESLGVMVRRPGEGEPVRWYNRPDWAGTITAEHYLRHVLRVHQMHQQDPGYLYVSAKDALAWVSDNPDPAAALPGGIDAGKLGGYKHVTTIPGDLAAPIIAAARDGVPVVHIEAMVLAYRRVYGEL